jgi:virginiamycin B lyase
VKKTTVWGVIPTVRVLGLGVLLLTMLSACTFPGSAPDVPAVPTAVGRNAHMSPIVHTLRGVQQGLKTVFALPDPIALKNLVGIGSAVWFGEDKSDRIAKITDQGQYSEYALPTANALPGWGTSGLNGNFWVSEEGANQIAQVSSQGDVTEYALPTANAKPGQMQLWGTMVWFTETGVQKIGRIDQNNQIVEFALNGTPDQLATAGSEEKNGQLWFTKPTSRKVGHITFDGQISEFPFPASITSLDTIVGDGAGNLWFSTGQSANNQLGYVTPDGHFTLFSTGRQNVVSQLMQDGDVIDFIEQNSNTIWTINGQGAIQARFTVPGTLSLPTPLVLDGRSGSYWYASTAGAQSQLWKLNISPYGP